MTTDGPTLWRHNVLLVGAVGSVWGYNSFGDVLINVCRALLPVPAMHYVDDFGSAEGSWSAYTAFWTFRQLNDILGLRTKPSKEQTPAPSHKVQGTIITFHTDHVEVAPTPARAVKLTTMIDKFTTENIMTTDDAATFAGKCQHFGSTTFGRIGRAPLKPVYARQHALPLPGMRIVNEKLTFALRSALRTLRRIINSCKPRKIPYACNGTGLPLVYADAFFEIGGQRYRPHEVPDDLQWDKTAVVASTNGWGAIVFPTVQTSSGPTTRWDRAFALRGHLPPSVLQPFCSRKAFIYFLEAFAQIIIGITFDFVLGPFYTTFCDNEAAKHAIIKGYGSDPNINNLIGMYWSHMSDSATDPWMERVSSKANLSDEVSRDCWQLASEAGWFRMEIDFSPIYPVLVRVATDEHYARTDAAKDSPQAMGQTVRSALRSCPWYEEIVFNKLRRTDHTVTPGDSDLRSRGVGALSPLSPGVRGVIDSSNA